MAITAGEDFLGFVITIVHINICTVWTVMELWLLGT